MKTLYSLSVPLLFVAFCTLFTSCGSDPSPTDDTVLGSGAPAGGPYYPIKLVNNAGDASNLDTTFFVGLATTYGTPNMPCALQFKYDTALKAQVGTAVVLAAGSNVSDYNFVIDTMQGYDATSKSIVLLIPEVQSGRMFMSFNHQLTIPITAAGKVVLPNVGALSDPNYGILFDKFEFTFNQDATMYLDATAVDFFGIPIHITTTSGSTSGVPANSTRNALYETVADTIKHYDLSSDSAWNAVFIMDSATNSLLRIISPSIAPAFDTSYLSDPSGFNWITNLFTYYETDSVIIDATELRKSGMEVFDKYGVSPQADPGAYYFHGKVVSSKYFIFRNYPSDTSVTQDPIIDTLYMDSITSKQFFGPGNGGLKTPNKTVMSIIVENLTGAFSVGLVPAASGDTLGGDFYTANASSFYTQNALLPANAQNTGPWYDLYAKGIHATNANMYAFAFDDLLGQSGTLTSSDLTDTITITIQDIGDIQIPNPSDFYSVLPATNATYGGFVESIKGSDTTYSVTIDWEVPEYQSSEARYFAAIGGKYWPIPIDTMVSDALKTGLLDYTDSTMTLTFTYDQIQNQPGGNNPDLGSMNVTVYTCKEGSTCPTPSNLSVTTSSGTAAVLTNGN